MIYLSVEYSIYTSHVPTSMIRSDIASIRMTGALFWGTGRVGICHDLWWVLLYQSNFSFPLSTFFSFTKFKIRKMLFSCSLLHLYLFGKFECFLGGENPSHNSNKEDERSNVGFHTAVTVKSLQPFWKVKQVLDCTLMHFLDTTDNLVALSDTQRFCLSLFCRSCIDHTPFRPI
jgi:hypothetical protein